MSEMVERVAAAMALQGGFIWEYMWESEEHASDEREARSYWRPFARAAIEAMREPTEGMIDAAEDQSPLYGVTGSWLAMIREALGEPRKEA